MTTPAPARRRAVAAAVAAVAALATTVPIALPSSSGGPVAAQAATGEQRSEVELREARLFALSQLARTERHLDHGRFPTVAPRGRWRTSGTNGWLAGFHPGSLWLAYQASGRPVWARRAADRQAPLAVRQDDTSTHDLGFLLQTSFGRGAALTGDRDDAAVTVRAATALASRWVPSAGALRSWNGPAGQATVIVDNLVNLELLFAAARVADRPQWRELALRHALTTAEQHVRPDGSTVHVVRFDEQTGEPVWKGTRQGLSDTSTWARGQSWAVHGFTTAYGETRNRRLLAAARRTADFAVAHLPRDGVPYWDYDAPAAGDRTRDTTAAAVLASGLLDLARLDPDAGRRASYARAGLHVLRTLAGPRYLAKGTTSPAVLLHGRHDPTYDDSGVTYGDHYFLQALLRAQLLPSPRPALHPRSVRTAGSRTTADLGSARRVSAVSVRWSDGASRATRLRIQTSRDGRTWSTARGAVSSGTSRGLETYDLKDRSARYVRVGVLGAGSVRALRVRG
jgi:unsaturated chondroitin disaccharide hydrolase